MFSKLNQEEFKKQILAVLEGAKANKRHFLETVELQIGLKNYDPNKDKRFAGAYRLPHIARPNQKICIIGDALHCDEAKAAGFDFIDMDGLKKFNKNKKVIKKWANKYDAFLSTDTIIKQIPRVLGPQLNKMNKFPSPITHNDNIKEKIADISSTVKFQLKKVLCLGVAVGHVKMTPEELKTNLNLSINFLISLLKKGWQNVRSLHVKSTMGKVQRIY
jgi:large subunit ribosomal protein L10Ae